jgi:iron-sulfur cluster assembly accessory protein
MLQIRGNAKSEETPIQVTERAAEKVLALMQAEDKDGYGLRVSVQGGGCSGFKYGLTWEREAGADDRVLEFHGLKVYLDSISINYLKGATVDYIDTLQGSGFKIENPNSTGSCGCGESFGV